jgi:hypothetical protein
MTRFSVLIFILSVAASLSMGQVITEQWRFQNEQPAADDRFGHGTAISADGTVAVIGAPWTDEIGADTGSAYVYRRTGDEWTLEQKLLATGNDAHVFLFGNAVAITADNRWILVGSRGDREGGFGAGAAYLFEHTDTGWIQRQKLRASDARSFGWSIVFSVDGQSALIGAIGARGATWGNTGAAYVFTRGPLGLLSYRQKLSASDGVPWDAFGTSVALSGDGSRALIGAPGSVASSTGQAYVFRRSGGQWIEEQKLLAGDAAIGHYFGSAVALSGDADVAIIGGLHGDHGAVRSGAAYVFRRIEQTWAQQQKLLPDALGFNSQFGSSAAITLDGEWALVGARFHESTFNQSRGSGFLYRRVDDSMQFVTELQASIAEGNVYFADVAALSLSADARTALIGAWSADPGGLHNAGAAYAFDLSPFTVLSEPPPALTLSRLAVYANPAFGRATVTLNLAQPEAVRLVVYDVLGREVRRLAEGVVASRSVDVDGLAPGLYLVVAEGDGWRQTARLVVAR